MQQFTPSTDNREFATGAIRGTDNDRGTFSLMPFHALTAIAVLFGGFVRLPVDALHSLCLLYQAGAKKYAARNWEKGIPLAVYVDSAWRHYRKLRKGMTDEVHAVQFAWNILCFVQTVLWINTGKLPDSLNTFPNVDTKEIALPNYSMIDDLHEPFTELVFLEKSWRSLILFIEGDKSKAHLIYAGAYALAFLQTHLVLTGEAEKLST